MNARIAELHNKVFSTPRNSPEREQAINSLSDSEREAVFNLERDYMLGRITRQDIAEMKQEGNETMTYAQYKKIMNNDCKGQLQEMSQFAKENRELYRQYSDRYGKEREAERNSQFTESTFKNKPFSISQGGKILWNTNIFRQQRLYAIRAELRRIGF